MASRDEIAQLLHDASVELESLYGELYMAEHAVLDRRVATVSNTEESTVAGVRLHIEIDEADLRKEVVRLKAQIDIQTERRDHLRFLLKYGLEGVVRVADYQPQ